MMYNRKLVLEDGTVFLGTAFGCLEPMTAGKSYSIQG